MTKILVSELALNWLNGMTVGGLPLPKSNVTFPKVPKLVPVILITVPPIIVPLLGNMLVIVGASALYEKFTPYVLCPSLLLTITRYCPAVDWAGVVKVILLVELALNLAKRIVAPAIETFDTAVKAKSVPLITTTVPPSTVPFGGKMLVIVGTAAATVPTMASRRTMTIQNTIRNGRGRIDLLSLLEFESTRHIIDHFSNCHCGI